MLQVLWQLEVKQCSTCAWQERVRDGTVGRSLCKALKLPPIFHWSPVPVFCDKTVKGLQRRHSLKAQKPKIAAAAAAADMKWFEAGRAAGTAALSGWRISARGARLVRKQLPWPTFSAPCEACLWIWFGEIGWADFFPSPPYKKKKKWVEATSSEHWRADTFHLSPDFWKRNISELKQEEGVVWGGTEVPRGAGGQVGPVWKEPVCCLKNRDLTWDWKKLFCLKEESFLRSEHSEGVTN